MKALVLLSGGVDSTTCLAIAVDKFGKDEVMALSVFYGQKHYREIQAARDIAAYYGVVHRELDLTKIFEGSDSSLLISSGNDIPEEDYSEQLKKTDGKPVSTYVPFRNGLFLSCAASIAGASGCKYLYYGAHSDDAAGNAYPDCSKEFNDAISRAVYIGSGNEIEVIAPFVGMNKAGVVREGLSLNVPYHMTWSCYSGGSVPCGKCGTCRDRRAAFLANGIDEIQSEQ